MLVDIIVLQWLRIWFVRKACTLIGQLQRRNTRQTVLAERATSENEKLGFQHINISGRCEFVLGSLRKYSTIQINGYRRWSVGFRSDWHLPARCAKN